MMISCRLIYLGSRTLQSLIWRSEQEACAVQLKLSMHMQLGVKPADFLWLIGLKAPKN